jgi:hypothetical protein
MAGVWEHDDQSLWLQIFPDTLQGHLNEKRFEIFVDIDDYPHWILPILSFRFALVHLVGIIAWTNAHFCRSDIFFWPRGNK